MNPVRRVRKFARRSQLAVLASLEGQLARTKEGMVLASRLTQGVIAPSQARAEMSVVEHQGDEERAELVAVLGRSLVNPIDREDLFRLSRSIDDVLDNLRDFVREYDLFELGPQPQLAGMTTALEEGIDALAVAVEMLISQPRQVKLAALTAKKNGVRIEYQLALAQLLNAPFGPETLKLRELLRRLDVVGLRIGEAADAMSDGAMKRSN